MQLLYFVSGKFLLLNRQWLLLIVNSLYIKYWSCFFQKWNG